MILVLAGVNGAGKSSLLGSYLRAHHGDYFNPDEYARRLLQSGRATQPAQANASAWQIGFNGLAQAIQHNSDYAFETTLGGQSVSGKLRQAIDNGIDVRVVFVGLDSAELHIERVSARVRRGGHAIDKARIRQRFADARLNLIGLIHHGLPELLVWDNSLPLTAGRPAPRKLFQFRQHTWIQPPDQHCPQWAKSIAVAAMQRLTE